MGMKAAIPILRQAIASILREYNEGKLTEISDLEAVVKAAKELDALFTLEEILVKKAPWGLSENINAIKAYMNTKIEKLQNEEEAEKARLQYMVSLMSIQVRSEVSLRLAEAVMKILEATEEESKSFLVKLVGKIIPNIADKIKARLGVKPILELAMSTYLKQKEAVPVASIEPSTQIVAAASVLDTEVVVAQIENLKAIFASAQALPDKQKEQADKIRANAVKGIQALLKAPVEACQASLIRVLAELSQIDAALIGDFELEPLALFPKLTTANLSARKASLVKASKKLADLRTDLQSLSKQLTFLKERQGSLVEVVPALAKMEEDQKQAESKLEAVFQLKAKLEVAVTEKTKALAQKEMRSRELYVAGLKAKLTAYVQQRSKTYARRDSISDFFARILNWFGLSYKTEKQEREQYITQELTPKLTSYVSQGEAVAKEVEDTFQVGLRLFSPRAKRGQEYQKSLKGLLEKASAEFQVVNKPLAPR